MRYAAWAALAVVGVVAVVWLWPGPRITNYPSGGVDIIAFGDSLVAGTGASPGHTLTDDLSRSIGRPIINLGVSGDTTESALERVSQLDVYNPKVVIVLLGGNDYLRRVPREQTFENLGRIIEHIQGLGAVVLVLGVRGGLLQDNFEGEFKSLTKKYHTGYVSDVLNGLLGNKELMYDQVHPNDAGYAIIAGRVAPALSALLQ